MDRAGARCDAIQAEEEGEKEQTGGRKTLNRPAVVPNH